MTLLIQLRPPGQFLSQGLDVITPARPPLLCKVTFTGFTDDQVDVFRKGGVMSSIISTYSVCDIVL